MLADTGAAVRPPPAPPADLRRVAGAWPSAGHWLDVRSSPARDPAADGLGVVARLQVAPGDVLAAGRW